ncbi:DEAD/DEAH box helicase [Methanobrevibacter woesei]|uniref:DEAD/DEAH box helicase n=1 Tax=Methanobrevibacter woesei TaxID=190976 RepID=UPI0026DEEB2F|nr:DEAD/DEAH box helicase [Methanobrevibacter woesei]
MSEYPIELLSDRVTSFLGNKLGWSKLNPIQEKAIPLILKNRDTLILAPTASGKTEAVLIPIFNEILTKGLKPVSVLYISPLKALINDIHSRIESWGNYFTLTATKWHGDVSKYDKDKFIKKPTDFLSTTPESLEVILMNRKEGEKNRIFNNIKYIVIDEIHYFADSDRGIQLNSLLNRLKEYLPNDVVTVGLSATVGNPEQIASWINPKKPATVVIDDNRRKFQYKILDIDENQVTKILSKYMEKKVLIFVNSRATAELVYSNLKKRLNAENVFIHHGSINKDTREENEQRFKEVSYGFMVATNTLELGIDIGNIDLVFHVKPPATVSGFLQRMGRSGRRKGIQRSIIAAKDVNIFKALAEIILSHESKVEDIHISKRSMDIFFHQILSSLFAKGRRSVNELYKELTQCYAFSEIKFDEYKRLLKHMEELKLVDYYEPYLSLGYNFEKEFGRRNFMEFFAVFMPSYEYQVKHGRQEIGGLDVSFAIFLDPNDTFTLAGKLWRVKSIDHELYHIQAELESNVKLAIPKWFSGGAPVNYLISRKMHEIILGNFDEKFLKPLDKHAREFIEIGCSLARQSGFSEGIIPIEKTNKGEYFIYTFAGDKANKLLATIFEIYYELDNVVSNPFYCSFKVNNGDLTNEDMEDIIYDVKNILKKPETIHRLDDLTAEFKKNKFIKYLPSEDRAELKNRILFDENALIDVIENNSLHFIPSECLFRKKILGYDL